MKKNQKFIGKKITHQMIVHIVLFPAEKRMAPRRKKGVEGFDDQEDEGALVQRKKAKPSFLYSKIKGYSIIQRNKANSRSLYIKIKGNSINFILYFS
jgi:hypothetical protein